MLEESKEVRASTRFSKAAQLFEDDPRWKVGALGPSTWDFAHHTPSVMRLRSCYAAPVMLHLPA